MTTQEVIAAASGHLEGLEGHIFDVLTIAKPVSVEVAVNLAKIISKLSPLLGNLIEFNTVEVLNTKDNYRKFGVWIRQDPDFPDTILKGSITPTPGFEIKAWFPLATEITARFKDSQNHFVNDNTYVAMLAWLPEFIIFGKPKIVGVCVQSGKSIATARDGHYHNPPDYLVFEPQDTKARTRNLQQTNTNGYKFQGTRAEFQQAEALVRKWGTDGRVYKPTPEYQVKLKKLIGKFTYRLDTNYAKMDRIAHPGLEAFKIEIGKKVFHRLTVNEWIRAFASDNDTEIRKAVSELGITDQGAGALVQ